jgi:hypothetical protein
MNPELGLGGRRLTGKKAIISLGVRQRDFMLVGEGGVLRWYSTVMVNYK